MGSSVMSFETRDLRSVWLQYTAPPSPAETYLPERKLKTAISPKEPATLPPRREPNACAQSSINGFPGAACRKAGISHTFPNMWTAMTASISKLLAARSAAEMQYVSGSTSMKRARQPAALIALKTTGQQYRGTATDAPAPNERAFRATTMAALADRTGIHEPNSGTGMYESPPARRADKAVSNPRKVSVRL